MLVAVFNARGRQGLGQVRELVKAGHAVRAMSRDPDPFLGETFEGVHIVPGDLDDEASLQTALAGVDVVFFTSPLIPADPLGRAKRLGAAAAKAGVKRLVFNTSGWTPDKPIGDDAGDTKLAQEDAFEASGVPFTSIRPVLFMDNLLTNWARRYIVGEGRYVYPHKAGLGCNWISVEDTAKYMIAAMDDPAFVGVRIVVGGPEQLLPQDVAAILSETLGKPIRYDPSTPEDFGWDVVRAFGDDIGEDERAPMAERIAHRYHYTNDHHTLEVDIDKVLERIPVELESFRDWAARQTWHDDGRPRPPGG